MEYIQFILSTLEGDKVVKEKVYDKKNDTYLNKFSKYGVIRDTEAEAKTVSLQEAASVFRDKYLNLPGNLNIQGLPVPEYVVITLADTAYNMGPQTAIKLLQRAIGLKEEACDGLAGPQTVNAINRFLSENKPSELLVQLYNKRMDYYESIDKKRISDGLDSYLDGWLSRMDKLFTFISDNYPTGDERNLG